MAKKVNDRGYEEVNVTLGSRKLRKCIRVHRAVAELFIPNPQNKPQVNHKDGIKTNNVVNNLEWVTQSENIQHGFKNGLYIR